MVYPGIIQLKTNMNRIGMNSEHPILSVCIQIKYVF